MSKLFSRLDPGGNGYVELGEWTAYLDTYGLQLGGERAAYLYTVIQSSWSAKKPKSLF